MKTFNVRVLASRPRVTGMAFDLADAVNFCHDHRNHFQQHLLKVLALPEHDSANHWAEELQAFLVGAARKVLNVKTSSGKLKSSRFESLLMPDLDSASTVDFMLRNSREFPSDLLHRRFRSEDGVKVFSQQVASAFKSQLRKHITDTVYVNSISEIDERISPSVLASIFQSNL
jgi:hypothetical protein